MENDKITIAEVEGEIQHIVSKFLYYDRKEDEDLPVDSIGLAVANGHLTIDEMTEAFRKALKKGLDIEDEEGLGVILHSTISNKGCNIAFKTEANLQQGDILEVEVGDKKQYFKVHTIHTEGNVFKIGAVETGYWAKYLSRKPDFDIRTLTGLVVNQITDKEQINKVREQATWC